MRFSFSQSVKVLCLMNGIAGILIRQDYMRKKEEKMQGRIIGIAWMFVVTDDTDHLQYSVFY